MRKKLRDIREIWQRIMRNWRTKYRLVLKNEDSHSEPVSLLLSPKNLFVVITTSAVVLIILTAMLIAFTPLRIYVPGYTSPDEYRMYKKMAIRVDSVEYLLKQNQQFIENMNFIIHDGTDDEMAKVTEEKVEPSNTSKGRPDEDEWVRQEAEDIILRLSENNTTARISNVRKADVTELKMQIPILGSVIQEFNPAKQQYGICISGEYKSIITSVAEGVVIYAGYDQQYGHMLIIQHAGNRISVYKNNAVLLKKSGDTVEGGEPVAKMGKGGKISSQPYLQFELWYNGFPVNPLNYLTIE